MLRKLLTLFAILTGLAAAGAPAHARIATLEEVRLEASSSLSAPCVAARRQVEANFGRGHQRVVRPAEPCARATITFRVPTVMLGVDRARE
jgi:hypothetical protein